VRTFIASVRAALSSSPPAYITFGAPRIGEAEIAELVDSLRSGWIGTGPKVHRFQELIRGYVGAQHAVAVNSCTAALHVSLVAAGIGQGDEVITSALTFGATANAILHAGATPVLVDCDRQTQLIDPDRVRAAITRRTRAIIPVHLAGRPCDQAALRELARQHQLIVIDDAAHALEAHGNVGKVGAVSEISCFSFYVTKNITTGEGGMITTNDGDLAAALRVYSHHGMSRDAWKRYSDAGFQHYEICVPGYKYNMTDLAASLGIHQFAQLDRWLRRREEIWRTYDDAFAGLPIGLPAAPQPGTVHARHLYTLSIDHARCGLTRDEFMSRLHERRVGTGVHYVGVHLQPYYRNRFGWSPRDFPCATWISERTVSIPLSPHLTDCDVERVIAAVRCVCS
jgi:dTDP-4-amino-4,6-dideoxygalactose transaminase